MKVSSFFLMLLAVLAVFLVGYNFKKNEELLIRGAGEMAVNEGIKYTKGQWEITKDWANSIGKYWQSIWR